MNLEDLPNTELKIGIEKSLDNAKDLIEEGDILFNERKNSRAYCLYQLATEEVGKSRLLFALIINREFGDNIDYKKVNKEFVHHQTKSKSALTFEMIAFLLMYSTQKEKSAEERWNNFVDTVEKVHKENDVKVLNILKNNSLYVGLKDRKFVAPKDAITREMAADLRVNVLIRLEAGKSILKSILGDLENIVNLVQQVNQLEIDEMGERVFDKFFKE